MLEEPQCRLRAEAHDDRLEEGQLRKVVPSALQEEHRSLDSEQVRGPFIGRPARRMKRKAQEYKTANARERCCRLRL